MKQTELAEKTKKSISLISKILNGRRRPSWELAKEIAELTGTDPGLWMDGTAAERQEALKAA